MRVSIQTERETLGARDCVFLNGTPLLSSAEWCGDTFLHGLHNPCPFGIKNWEGHHGQSAFRPADYKEDKYTSS